MSEQSKIAFQQFVVAYNNSKNRVLFNNHVVNCRSLHDCTFGGFFAHLILLYCYVRNKQYYYNILYVQYNYTRAFPRI